MGEQGDQRVDVEGAEKDGVVAGKGGVEAEQAEAGDLEDDLDDEVGAEENAHQSERQGRDDQ